MNTKTRALVESAVMVALATVLSVLEIWKMPFGGSITPLSMLPIMLISIRHGLGWGLGAAFCYSWLQIFTGGVFGWGLTPAILIGALFLDYMIPFTLLGLAGLFRKKGTAGILAGILMVCIIRFLCHFAAGIIFWTETGEFIAFGEQWVNRPVLYSLCYNGAYMLPETVFTFIGSLILTRIPQAKKMIFGI